VFVASYQTTCLKALTRETQFQGQDATTESLLPGGNLLLNPTPELMLGSCLVFGCCVSSFVHRRQSQDTCQFAVYAVFLTAAVVSGVGIEASADLILLGFAPWAMCAAMATSLYGHAFYRRQRKQNEKRSGDDEKALLFV
jgi:hypothetical protein